MARSSTTTIGDGHLTPMQLAFASALGDVLLSVVQQVASMPAEDFSPGADLPTRVREHLARSRERRALDRAARRRAPQAGSGR